MPTLIETELSFLPQRKNNVTMGKPNYILSIPITFLMGCNNLWNWKFQRNKIKCVSFPDIKLKSLL